MSRLGGVARRVSSSRLQQLAPFELELELELDAFNRVNDGSNVVFVTLMAVFAWPLTLSEDGTAFFHHARPEEAPVNISILGVGVGVGGVGVGVGGAACFIVAVLVDLWRRQLREEHRLFGLLLDAPALPDAGSSWSTRILRWCASRRRPPASSRRPARSRGTSY